MVVNWTGGKPDREGFWLIAIKPHLGNRYLPNVIGVNCNDDGMLYVHSPIFPKDYTVDELFGGELNFSVKCATAPIQIDNVDWDYKYEEGE